MLNISDLMMSAHFLLTSRARTLSLRDVFSLGEKCAYDLFRELRWPETNGEPVCPRCQFTEAYGIPTRRKFKCKACHHQFSVTSGTILAARKMSFTDLLAAVVMLINGAKGVSSLQLARDLNCQHKTAFVLAHKLRQAMSSEDAGAELSGEVEVDGCYVGGHIRKANLKKNRRDRRLARNQTGKRRVVVAARERGGRILTTVVRHEADGIKFVADVVADGSTLFADEASHWDALHVLFRTNRINHTEAYSFDGVHTNFVESFFARVRNMVRGQHHHVSPQHLHLYASHAAWMEDHRRMDNGALVKSALSLALAHTVSREWKGYWQRSGI
jgi:transposase-like protein